MEFNFDYYLNSSVAFLRNFRNKYEISQNEIEEIVNHFSNQLKINVCRTNNNSDISKFAFEFVFRKSEEYIQNVSHDLDTTVEQYQIAIHHCERELLLLDFFISNNLLLPKKKSKIELISRSLFLKKNLIEKLPDLLNNVEEAKELQTIAQCDKCLNTIATYLDNYEECLEIKLGIPSTIQIDLQKIKKDCLELKDLLTTRDETENSIKLEISSLGENPATIGISKKIISYCKTLELLSIKYVKNGFGNLKCNCNYQALTEQYNHYVLMEDLDDATFILMQSKLDFDKYTTLQRNCKRQLEYINQCKINGWRIPFLQNNNYVDLQKKYSLYIKMYHFDNIISTNKRYTPNHSFSLCILENCDELEKCIADCNKNKWNIPSLTNQNYTDLKKQYTLYEKMLNLDDEIHNIIQLKPKSSYLRNLKEMCNTQSSFFDLCNKQKWEIPQLKCANCNEIYFKYKFILKLKKIIAIICMIAVSIFICHIAFKIQFVTVSSLPKCNNISDFKNSYSMLGFRNINFSYVPTDSRMLQDSIKDVSYKTHKVFGRSYTKKTDNIDVIYYEFSPTVTSREYSGINYKDVEKNLKERGFISITTIETTSGIGESGKVVDVSFNGKSISSQPVSYRAPVKIVYNSMNRLDAGIALHDWKKDNKDYTVIADKLKKLGLKNIQIQNIRSFDKTNNKNVTSILIDGKEYNNGTCFIDVSLPVYIKCYEYFSKETSKDYIGIDYKQVHEKLKENLFENITLYSTPSGIGESGKVVDVSFDGKNIKSQSISYKTPVNVVYNSLNRLEIGHVLRDWKKNNPDYTVIVDKLKKIGLKDIQIQNIQSFSKTNNKKIASIIIDGKEYNNGTCFIDASLPVYIKCYEYFSKETSKDYIGIDYKQVHEKLKENLFENITLIATSSGTGESGKVVEVSFDGKNVNSQPVSYKTPVKIVYNSLNRLEIGQVLRDWKKNNPDYTTVVNNLKKIGLKDPKIHRVPIKTFNIASNQKINSIRIDNKEYDNNTCFIDTSNYIEIIYNYLHIYPGDSSDYHSEDEDSYKIIVNKLKKLGFSDITVYRNNRLVLGLLWESGSIDSFKIDGKSHFSSTDSFAYDAPIEIVVNTFKTGCNDIYYIYK